MCELDEFNGPICVKKEYISSFFLYAFVRKVFMKISERDLPSIYIINRNGFGGCLQQKEFLAIIISEGKICWCCV